MAESFGRWGGPGKGQDPRLCEVGHASAGPRGSTLRPVLVGGVELATEILKRARALFGRGEPEPAPAPAKKTANPFHSVTIVTGPRACAAARALSDRRFLSREAPALPLKACDCAGCSCRYEHYDDRRKSGRRARDLGVSIDGYDGGEKRTKAKRGRRKSDS